MTDNTQTIRAKFVCSSVTTTLSQQYDSASSTYVSVPLCTYNFYPVSSGSDENKRFFASTPSGTVQLGVVNPAVTFQVGQEYYLDFTAAIPVSPGLPGTGGA